MIGLSSVLTFEMVGGIDVVRHLHRAQPRVGFLERRVDVLVRVEGEFDVGRALAHVRLDVLHALDRDDRLLDRIHDLRLHHLRRRAGPLPPEMVSTGGVASGSWLTPR